MTPPRRALPLVGGTVEERIAIVDPPASPAPLHEKPAPRRSIAMLVARLGRGWPLALVAVTAPTTGCFLSHSPEDVRADAGPMDAARDASRDARPPRPDFGPPPLCFGSEERFTVDVPPPGVPADASLICVSEEDAISNEAARVSLVLNPRDSSLAHGTITIVPALRDAVIGTPTVELVDRGFAYWPEATIGAVTTDGDVFRFDVVFAAPVEGEPESSSVRAVFEVRFELDCGGGARRTVIASTVVYVCIEDDRTLSFASSGEECRTCAIIAEMAPTPIIPAEKPDRLPLQQGMHLELRVLGRFPNAVVLWAEHDAGNARYEWHATHGTLHLVEADIAVWEIDEHPLAAAQVVVQTDSSAAIASHRRGGAA